MSTTFAPAIADLSRRTVLEGFSSLPVATLYKPLEVDPWFQKASKELHALREKVKKRADEVDAAEADFKRMYPAYRDPSRQTNEDDRRAAINTNVLRARGFEVVVGRIHDLYEEAADQADDLFVTIADRPARSFADLKLKVSIAVAGDEGDREIMATAVFDDLVALTQQN